MRNGKVRSAGINVHRRHINLDFRRNFFEIELANAARAEAETGFELHRYPLGIFADLERNFLGICCDLRLALIRIGTYLELGTQFPALLTCERIVWAGNISVKSGAVPLNWNTNPAFTEFIPLGASGAETECSLAAFQVGNAHARKQYAREFLWRKRHG